jgi:peptidoglycan/LPS O-acetylase OafA/YrhL
MNGRQNTKAFAKEGEEITVSSPPEQTANAPKTADEQTKPGRFEGLEAYRGIAAVLIVVFHTYQYSREGRALNSYVYEGTPLHAFLGNLDVFVSMFFVLSGFLIFLPFARAAVNRSDRQSARYFLIRRAIRIVPLYYTAILIVWAYRPGGGWDHWVNLFEHLTFTQVFSREHIFYTIGPAWSLSVEVLFYLFVAVFGPLAYLGCGRVRTTRARAIWLAGTILVLGLASVLYKWWAHYVEHIPQENGPVYFGPLAKLDTFALGMLLAVGVVVFYGRSWAGGVFQTLLRVSGLALLVALFVWRSYDTGASELYIHTLVGLAFVLVLASSVFASKARRRFTWEWVLARPELQFLGLVSYSVYIWHEPLMRALANHGILISKAPAAFPWNALVLVIVSIVVASLSYQLVERPAMDLRYLFTREGRIVKRYTEYSER